MRIGDAGCPGVDTAGWLQANRCPTYPGKTNRWVLLRTLRDNADDVFIRQSLQAVLAKWLGTITGWDPVGEATGHTRVGPADNITVVKIVRGRLPADQYPSDWTNARRREQLPQGPLPTLVSGDYCSILLEFDWRSQVGDIPWPIWTGGAAALESTRDCPTGADWMLDRAGMPVKDSPAEVPLGEQLEEGARELGESALRATALPLIVGGVLLGLVAFIVSRIS